MWKQKAKNNRLNSRSSPTDKDLLSIVGFCGVVRGFKRPNMLISCVCVQQSVRLYLNVNTVCECVCVCTWRQASYCLYLFRWQLLTWKNPSVMQMLSQRITQSNCTNLNLSLTSAGDSIQVCLKKLSTDTKVTKTWYVI